jgi:transposase
MHDNAASHRADSTRELLRENKVKIIKHPPYSPDLNPIEHVWAKMK